MIIITGMIYKKELKSITKNIYNKWNSLIFLKKNKDEQKIHSKILSEYCIGMITAYTRKEASEILWIKTQSISKSDKVIKVMVWSVWSKKYVSRYLLTNEVINERPIKERLKEKVR